MGEPQIIEEIPPKKSRHRKKLLYSSIKDQMEFYFSDVNISKDRFISQLIQENPYIDLSVFLQFNKIRRLTEKVSDLCKSISKSDILQLSEDNLKVCRKTPIRVKGNADECTIYVERLPADSEHEWLRNIFTKFGPVDYVSIPRYTHNKMIKGFAFIEFDLPETAKKALEYFESIGCKLPTNMLPDQLVSISSFDSEKAGKHQNILNQFTTEVEAENTKESSENVKVPKNATEDSEIKVKRKKRKETDADVETNEVKRSKKEKPDYETETEQSNKLEENEDSEIKVKRKKWKDNDVNIETNEVKKSKKEKSDSETKTEESHKLEGAEESEIKEVKKKKKGKKQNQDAEDKQNNETINNDEMELEGNKKENEEIKETELESNKKAEEAEGQEECRGEDITGEKKKRKRKKCKSNSNDLQQYGLQVLSKKEWKQLRNKYLNLQRQKMQSLKEHLHRRNFTNVQNNAENCTVDKNSLENKNKGSAPRFEFTPGVIVHINLLDSFSDVKKFKNDIRSQPGLQYIDLKTGSNVGYIRFSDNNTAKKFCESENINAKKVILEGNEEKDYWEQLQQNREEKFKKDNKQKQRGRDKLLRKAEKELGKHIRFENGE